jgi:hypothetical protein
MIHDDVKLVLEINVALTSVSKLVCLQTLQLVQ